MRVKLIIAVVFGAMLVSGGAAGTYAAEEHHHEGEAAHVHAVASSSDAQSLTGEVVDLVCYSSHPESGIGPGHAGCAQKCIGMGLPVAIRSNGALYVALGAGHETANQLLAAYGGQVVTVHGKVIEQDGLKMVQVESVEKTQ